MLRRALLVALGATFAETTLRPLRGGAAELLKPLRKLVYHVEFHIVASGEQTVLRRTMTGRRGGGTTTTATVTRQGNLDDAGTLTLEVVAATRDGGLVVDSAFSGRETEQPKVRVAIFPDGTLSFDPRVELSPESTRVLPLLARGLVADREVSPGVTWTTTTPKPTTGTMTYRVEHVEGERATLAIENDTVLGGPSGFSEHGHATTVYATDRLCPLSYDLEVVVRHRRPAAADVNESEHLIATLVSDTFATPSR